MDPEARREHWQTVFREKPEGEVSWFQERPGTSLELVARTGVERSARIVDVGGGASRLVDGLLDAGYEDVVVVDIAEAALAKAKARLGARAERVRWIVSDLLAWTPDTTFDVWHDRAVFHFMIEAEDRETYLTTMRRAVKPGGHVILATFAENGPEKCSGLPVHRYSPETLTAQLGPGFRLVESLHEEHATPAGRMQAFQFSRFQRVG
ncbi:MAG: class I SAM-dependent methyltransferase [Deltaproteobacteria bacterium]|nr:class I SAM-dependent methyltransferase [Deltaproteobacteria bacterium]